MLKKDQMENRGVRNRSSAKSSGKMSIGISSSFLNWSNQLKLLISGDRRIMIFRARRLAERIARLMAEFLWRLERQMGIRASFPKTNLLLRASRIFRRLSRHIEESNAKNDHRKSCSKITATLLPVFCYLI